MHSPPSELGVPLDAYVVNLANTAVPSYNQQSCLSDLIQDKANAKEYFYGLEITPGLRQELNYNTFKIAPLFTSIVWIASQNLDIDSMDNAPAFQLAKYVKSSGPTLSHLSCQNLTYDKLQSFLDANIRNLMVVRGDIVEEGQPYRFAVDLVREIRKIKKDDICISVGGYPDGHPESSSKEEDLRHLKEKVDAGANLIITQLTFSATTLIEFIRNCRKMGITVPILPGIYIPRSWSALQFISNLTKVKPPKDVYEEYEKVRNNSKEFNEYAIRHAVRMIRAVFESDLEIYGVQFFTLNYFKNIEQVVQEVFV